MQNRVTEVKNMENIMVFGHFLQNLSKTLCFTMQYRVTEVKNIENIMVFSNFWRICQTPCVLQCKIEVAVEQTLVFEASRPKMLKNLRFSLLFSIVRHRPALDPHPQGKAQTTRTLRSRSREKSEHVSEKNDRIEFRYELQSLSRGWELASRITLSQFCYFDFVFWTLKHDLDHLLYISGG